MELIIINKKETCLEIMLRINSKLYDSSVIPLELIQNVEKRILNEFI